MIAPFLDIDRDGPRPAASLQIFFWALNTSRRVTNSGAAAAGRPMRALSRLADVAGFWTLDRTTITGRSAVILRQHTTPFRPMIVPFDDLELVYQSLRTLEPPHTHKFPRVNAQDSKLGPIQPWDVKDFLRPGRVDPDVKDFLRPGRGVKCRSSSLALARSDGSAAPSGFLGSRLTDNRQRDVSPVNHRPDPAVVRPVHFFLGARLDQYREKVQSLQA